MATKKPYEPKIGHKVNVSTRTGNKHAGKVVSEHPGSTGTYYAVNIGDTKAPILRKYRASELARA